MVKKKKIYKKGQSFSIDLLIVIVVILFGVLFLVMNEIQKVDTGSKDINELQEKSTEQSKIIVDELKMSNIIDDNNNVEIEQLLQVDMEQLKADLNIDNDFCIVFEKDGKLVKIDPNNEVYGIGSTSDIAINNIPCTIR